MGSAIIKRMCGMMILGIITLIHVTRPPAITKNNSHRAIYVMIFAGACKHKSFWSVTPPESSEGAVPQSSAASTAFWHFLGP